MKKSLILITLVLTSFAAFVGCKTAIPVSGAAIQFIGCELCQAKPVAKAPMLAGGQVFNLFAASHAPTAAELAACLAAIPKIEDKLEQSQIDSVWVIVCFAWDAVQVAAKTPEQQRTLLLTLGTIGRALERASECGTLPPPSAKRGVVTTYPNAQERAKQLEAASWSDLAKAIKNEIKKAKR